MRRLLFVLLLGAAGGVQAAPVTIDFEGFAVGASGALVSNGFVIDGGASNAYEGPSTAVPASVFVGANGTHVYGASISGWAQDSFGSSAAVTVSREDDGAFALYAADFFAATDFDGYTYIAGQLAGGGFVTNDSTPLGTGDWLNVVAVSFVAQGGGFWPPSIADVAVDNIVVSAVPVPAAIWLFGSALAGLLLIRQTVRQA